MQFPGATVLFGAGNKPFDLLQLFFVDRVETDRASRPFDIGRAEVVQYARETEYLGPWSECSGYTKSLRNVTDMSALRHTRRCGGRKTDRTSGKFCIRATVFAIDGVCQSWGPRYYDLKDILPLEEANGRGIRLMTVDRRIVLAYPGQRNERCNRPLGS
jgi:hypothetical protein